MDERAEKLKVAFMCLIFQEAKLKCRLFQSEHRRNSHHYKRRPSVKMNVNEVTSEVLLSGKLLHEIKVDRELEMIISIYAIALESMNGCMQGNNEPDWARLSAAIAAQRQNEDEVQQALQQVKQNKLKLKELRSQLDIKRQQTEQRLNEQIEKLHSLRYNLRNVRQLNALELDLVQKWEQNRNTQATIVGVNAENLLQQQITYYQKLQAAESCSFQAAMKFLKLQMANYEKTIANWQQKFSSKLIECEKKIQKQEQGIFELVKWHERQRIVYKERMQYVEAYLAQKALEEQLLLQEMQRVQSAIQIQAWWRGTMVRRGLGPYRKKSKKSKKSKK